MRRPFSHSMECAKAAASSSAQHLGQIGYRGPPKLDFTSFPRSKEVKHDEKPHVLYIFTHVSASKEVQMDGKRHRRLQFLSLIRLLAFSRMLCLVRAPGRLLAGALVAYESIDLRVKPWPDWTVLASNRTGVIIIPCDHQKIKGKSSFAKPEAAQSK